MGLELEEIRDAAIQRAIYHANAVHMGWSDRAHGMLCWALACRREKGNGQVPFMAEDVRRWAEERGLPTPPDPRAWGGVFQRAAREGLIERAGFSESRNKQAHMRPTAMWRAS